MLYDYILKNIKYSFMPHFALWPRGEAESVYVHRLQRGDCGAQSIYFVALCRALGIPARTTGGWQLFKNEFSSHFWAEFFVPNYGWIPVDPTAAELADLTNRLSVEQTERFKEFYFGGQDPLRCNAQLDVDLPLIPPAEAEIALPMAIQYPVANSSQMMDPPASIVMMMNWTTNLELISGQGGLPQ